MHLRALHTYAAAVLSCNAVLRPKLSGRAFALYFPKIWGLHLGAADDALADVDGSVVARDHSAALLAKRSDTDTRCYSAVVLKGNAALRERRRWMHVCHVYTCSVREGPVRRK